jgi:hypothetical protein
MKWLVVVRDLISIAVGAFGLIHSQLTGQSSTELLAIYTVLLGYPGVLQMVELRKKPPKDGPGGG